MSPALNHALDQVRSAWRFRWPALLCTWIVAILGWGVVFSLPGRYDTQARVFLDMTSSLRPLLEGLAVAPNTSNQVEIVKRAILGRPQLDRVVSGTGLAQRARTPAEREAVLRQLTQKIRIVGDVQSRNYEITYSDSNPDVSYAVVATLLDAFVSQSVQANRTDAESAQKFLTVQIQEYEQRLVASEKLLADFKSQHIGSMPDDRGGYFERLQAEIAETDRLTATLSVALRRREELRHRLGGGAPRQSTEQQGQIETSVDARLLEARRRLDDMLLNYTTAHPDVIALQETITALEKQRQAELDSLRNNVDSLGAPRSNGGSLVQQNLQIALNEVEVEVTSLRAQIGDREERVNKLRASINTLPQVEAELARLNRDYGTNRVQYDALLQRLQSARLSDQAQRSQEVIFKVVEPPVRPLTPAAPNRMLLAIGVLLAALAAGGGLAYVMSLIRPVYLGPDPLRQRFEGIRVIGMISLVPNARTVMRERIGVLLYAGLAGALVVALGVVLFAYQRWGTLTALLGGQTT